MNDVRSSDCQQLAAQLSEFIDGELNATSCSKIKQHLADCAACHIVFDTLTKTITVYRNAPREPVPPHWRKRILDFQISEVKE